MIKDSEDIVIQQISKGFEVNRVELLDGETKEIFWDSKAHLDWQRTNINQIVIACIPKSILKCKSVIRRIEFRSQESIKNLNLNEYIFMNQQVIDEQNYSYGELKEGDRKKDMIWEQNIESGEEDEMVGESEQEGGIHIYIQFLEGEEKIKDIILQIFYQ